MSRTVGIQTIASADGNNLTYRFVSPDNMPGIGVNWRFAVYLIHNVPDDISDAMVMRLFKETILVDSDVYELDFLDLGYGKMVFKKRDEEEKKTRKWQERWHKR